MGEWMDGWMDGWIYVDELIDRLMQIEREKG